MKLLICLAIISGLSSYSLAGTESSGGGPSLVCKNKSHSYDLFEGEVFNSYTYPSENLEPAELALKHIDKIKAFPIKAVLTKNINQILSSMRFLPSGLNLQAPADMGRQVGIITPEGCSLQGAGYFGNDGTLLVDSDVYNGMNNLNKAAFLLHEAVYLAARETSGETDSYSTRQAVSALFANEVHDDAKNTIYKDLFFRTNLFEKASIEGFIKSNVTKAKLRILPRSLSGKYFFGVSCHDGQGKQVGYYHNTGSSNEFEVDLSNCDYLDITTTVDKKQANFSEQTLEWLLVDANNNQLFDGTKDYLNYQESFFHKNLILIDRN